MKATQKNDQILAVRARICVYIVMSLESELVIVLRQRLATN